MKKTLHMLLTAFMALCLAACSNSTNVKQTASAYLAQDKTPALEVTVDLSNGWSAEFARGAAYLYDGEITEGKESVAIVSTVDKDVYEENLKKAQADEGKKEVEGGIFYTNESDEGVYLTAVSETTFVTITAKNKADIEAIAARVTLAMAN